MGYGIGLIGHTGCKSSVCFFCNRIVAYSDNETQKSINHTQVFSVDKTEVTVYIYQKQ